MDRGVAGLRARAFPGRSAGLGSDASPGGFTSSGTQRISLKRPLRPWPQGWAWGVQAFGGGPPGRPLGPALQAPSPSSGQRSAPPGVRPEVLGAVRVRALVRDFTLASARGTQKRDASWATAGRAHRGWRPRVAKGKDLCGGARGTGRHPAAPRLAEACSCGCPPLLPTPGLPQLRFSPSGSPYPRLGPEVGRGASRTPHRVLPQGLDPPDPPRDRSLPGGPP